MQDAVTDAIDNHIDEKVKANEELPAESNLGERPLLRWISPQVLRLSVYLTALVVTLYIVIVGLEDAVDTLEIAAILAIGLLFAGAYFCLMFREIDMCVEKSRMWTNLMIVEKKSNQLKEGAPPDAVIDRLLDMRYFLIQYAAPRKGYSFPAGFFESQLRRRIDVVFSCISETLYRRYWNETKREEGASPTDKSKPQKEFGYEMLGSWMIDLRSHLVGTRRWLRTSAHEISTLLYFFEDWQTFFKLAHKDEFNEYKDVVNNFYDRQEETIETAVRRRKEFSLELTKYVVIAVIVGILGFYLGTN